MAGFSKRRKRGNSEAKLNITSMMDMFTIILVFLLKSFSAQGQLVAPAKGLTIPQATVDSTAVQAIGIEISMDHKEKDGKMRQGKVQVEGKFIVMTNEVKDSKSFLIPQLEEALKNYAEQARKASELFKEEFKGDVNIQADSAVSYDILTKVMFTCGQSGFPNMQMVVYKQD
ncbi:MAG: biopolymer transporter ExbD [Fibrobacteres bacterium]|nr:biopolymer transporter ExbD [Fibrobacterota bacterium]